MPISVNTIISALDTPSSLLPFFVKDGFDVTGRTVMAQKEGGKHEAREKFIEEAGTSLFWIGGIPAVRGIINLFVKKEIDSEIHFKRINTEGIQSYAADKLEKSVNENGKDLKKAKFSKQDLEGIELGGGKLAQIQEKLFKNGFVPNKSKGLYGKYHVGVTAAAVLINLVVLTIAIPKLNQLLSRKIISKEVNGQNKHSHLDPSDTIRFGSNNKVDISDFMSQAKSNHSKPQAKGKNPSFGGFETLFNLKNLFNFTEMAEKAQLNPVNGMLLLDYGISGGRVTITPRNNNERIENIVKEGGIIFFFYFAADIIKDKFCELSNKWFHTPIDLDYKILNSKDFLNKFKKHKNKEDVVNFVDIVDTKEEIKKSAKTSKTEIKKLTDEIAEINEVKVIKMIDKELSSAPKESIKESLFKNFTLQMAQKEGLIDVEYDSTLQKWIRHSKKYIQTDKIIGLNENVKNFYEKAFEQIKKAPAGMNIEKIIAKTKKMKIASIFGNMAICCASLSFILPKIQYIIREHRTQTKSAPGIKLYQEMAEKNMI